jgi:hypothetical protein
LSLADLRSACVADDPGPIADAGKLLAMDGEQVLERWPVIARGRVR